ncbi:protocatechuate 3,4-dioxygenase alpha subunit [Actinoplanes campanulatus]|uniref:Protocatechuate 3,4-dioxygenase alpha subunit n=1 Tax=Actinoplanes campanulatus TaxID=113559 RepID=A0A7W5AG76_9ACTN|nr:MULTISPECIES: protocatechuate 3,4-dioxygenase subunit alpha [Actinoplanes]MBB3095404.1 protocatechuate 3,4-dioxygenase alpha subunit [Actinoplanes campanulatus]GGN41934.1 protocatechuate 3,4-dioxygenase subunit alpha [Actinoplanes campanulatus]GID35008.1 protocatechuate 3,4-dioxygenase subunit alpha [Actinoplanes campanulatus]GID46951.1 protocatechuate 3,4-dioxygenase subunit alpha [Actinoplanes capillaceus]
MSAVPGQTVGPFFHLGLEYDGMNELVPPGHPRALRLHGHVYDGAGAPVPDAVIEIWQADPQGHIPRQPGSLRRDGWTFTGWGRAATGPDGHYQFTTLEPGATEPGKAPFFAVTVFARGLLDRLFTRAYLPDDPDLLANDTLLESVAPDRRATLIARRVPDGAVFDIRLQGDDETVFLTYPRLRDAWA